MKTPFDFDQAIAAWRREMAVSGLSAEIVSELEEHLREDFERHVESGVQAAAWAAAVERVGRPAALRKEFERAGRVGIGARLRRHWQKWAMGAMAGVVVAGIFQWIRPGVYHSEAKLLVRMPVLKTASEAPGQSGAIGLTTEGDTRIGTLLEVLTSLDVLDRVARKVGPEVILPDREGADVGRAIAYLRNNLVVLHALNSSVLQLKFRHPDPQKASELMREITNAFLETQVSAQASGLRNGELVFQFPSLTWIQRPSAAYFDAAPLIRMQLFVVVVGAIAGLAWALIAGAVEIRAKILR